ncbi:MAG: DUF4058 family protein [Planctomycetota bacterium]
MPSPFPGMNPYLENRDVWQDFHDSFLPAIRASLAPQISPYFIVKLEERLYIHEPSAEERLRVGNADVALSRASAATKGPTASQHAQLTAPRNLRVSTDFEIEKQLYLEVQTRTNREVVAIIELLSPSNKKPGMDRDQYIAKRRGILHSQANFIEIDLLRGWERMPVEEMPLCDYGVLVSRYENRPDVGFWPLLLADRLPTIPVPLRNPAIEASLDLQQILHGVYDQAYYKDYIYKTAPEPPLVGADLEWANAVLVSSGINIS